MSQHVDGHSCHEVLNLLEAWIDGELDPTEANAVETHIEECVMCQAARVEAEDLVTELRSLPEFSIPERLLQIVEEQARPTVGERIEQVFRVSILRPWPALAAVTAVVLMAVVIASWRGPSASHYSEQEIARATKETKLALAYVGNAARRAESRVKERVLDDGVTARTVRGVNRTFKFIGEAAAASADLPTTPLPHAKGS